MDKDSSKGPAEQALFAGEAWFDPIEAGLSMLDEVGLARKFRVVGRALGAEVSRHVTSRPWVGAERRSRAR